ncbi:MAG: hypothetical protein JW818_05095 [Pirellulales bacterium]|nr:hypothetical protein [Pirellulales bacterium]
MVIPKAVRTWICRVLRILLVLGVVVFLALCGVLCGEMSVFSRVVTIVMTTVAAGVVMGLATLIGLFCGPAGCVVNLRRHLLLWALSVAVLLALSIVFPSMGVTFYQLESPEHSNHHHDWDWDWD